MKQLSPFDIQDIFFLKMKEDYQAGMIPEEVYRPYFDWKFRNAGLFSLQEAYAMLDAVSDELGGYYSRTAGAFSVVDEVVDGDPWQNYKAFGEDKYRVSYLEQLDTEVSRLIVSGLL